MSLLVDGGCLVAKVKLVSERIFDKLIKESGIQGFNAAQGRILLELHKQGAMPINELSNVTALGKTTLTSMIDRLEQSGSVIRQSDPSDRRKYIIQLTSQGSDLVTQYINLSDSFTHIFYKGLNQREIENLTYYLENILTNLSDYEKK